MSQLCKGVDLIHELRQRGGAEELLYRHHDRTDVDKSLRSDVLLLLLSLESHSLADNSLHSRQTDSELILEQLAHAADTSVAEVVDVVRGAYLVCKAVDIVYRREDIVDYDVVRDKVVVAESELLEKSLFVVAALVDYLGDYLEANLFVDAGFKKLFLGHSLGHIVHGIDHAVGDDLDLLALNIGDGDHNACALDLLSLRLGNNLACLGKNLTGQRSDNGLGKLAACKAGGNGELLIIFVSADARDIVSARIEEEIVEQLLGGLKGHGLAGTQTLEDFHERFALVLRLVSLDGGFDSLIVAEELADLIVRTESECSDESGDEYLSVLVYSYIIDVVYVRLILKPCAAVGVDCA